VGANVVAAVLVEGWSDEAALEALALRHRWDLRAEGIMVVPMGGATNVKKFVEVLGPQGLDIRLAVLSDAAEALHVRRDLERAGLAAQRSGANRQVPGLFVCHADLEDELIRALGTPAVERVLDAEGELASFRAFQGQPAQRGRDHLAQLRRFMGTRAGRKIRYGALLIDALEPGHVPRPLDQALAHVRG